jgi:hypothetical protein
MTQKESDLKKLAVIRKKIEALEKEMAVVKKAFDARPAKKKKKTACCSCDCGK